jgi:hypothetical protein
MNGGAARKLHKGQVQIKILRPARSHASFQGVPNLMQIQAHGRLRSSFTRGQRGGEFTPRILFGGACVVERLCIDMRFFVRVCAV